MGDKMNKLLIASLALLAAGGTALAADLSPPPAVYKAPPPPPAPTWTGCYINAGGGGGMWKSHDTDTVTVLGTIIPASVASDNGGEGWLGVAGAGCDYQFHALAWDFVIGAFGDYDWMDLHGVSSHPAPLVGSIEGDSVERAAWAGGLRLGILVTPTLLGYTNGGYTGTHFSQENDFTSFFGIPTGTSLPAHNYNGWFVGGGTEYALNWSWLPFNGLFWRTEYRFSYYESANLPFVSTATGAPIVLLGVPVGEHTSKDVQTIYTELVWRFNWAGPIAARF